MGLGNSPATRKTTSKSLSKPIVSYIFLRHASAKNEKAGNGITIDIMVFSHKFRYVYFAPPKTASSSIIDVLVNKYDGQFWGRADKHENLLPLSLVDYFCFTSVRNPYQRGISAYNYLNRKRQAPLPLSVCKNRFHLISMTDYFSIPLRIRRFVTVGDDLSTFLSLLPVGFVMPRLDHYIKVESLEEDFSMLPFVSGKQNVPRLNQSVRDLGCHEEIFDFIRLHHQQDFARFGYEI